MLFRRRSRSRDSSAAQLSPTKAAKNHTPKTIEEILALSANLPKAPQHGAGSSDDSYHSHNSSSDQSQGYRRQPTPKRTPTSRKTGFATIRTDSTDTHAAFESDAFAVLMPTTRVPIMDRPISPTKVASPAARAEAFRAYQEKARQVRERNNSQGVKVPSKIMSYDYASRQVATQEIEAKPPTPAGSYPVSPPLPQHTWARTERAVRTQVQETRHVHGLSNISKPAKSATSHSTTTTTTISPTSCYRVYRADSTAGASRSTPSPTPLPATIKVRIMPKPVVLEQERVQTESRSRLYDRPSDTSSTRASRSSSPVKSMPNFTRHNSFEGDSIFGYKSKDLSGTVAGASLPVGGEGEKDKGKETKKETEKEKEKDKVKPVAERPIKTTPKRTLTTRWPWLRPSGPRIGKPTTVPVVFSTPAAKPTTATTTTAYVDPFATHASPTPTPISLRSPVASRPASPKKTVARTPISAPCQSTDKFDTGFAQIKSFSLLLLKIGLLLYGVIALWFILDAIREAFNTIAAPFRVVRWIGGYVGILAVWFWGFGVKLWERWGFKIALRRGWMWGMRW